MHSRAAFTEKPNTRGLTITEAEIKAFRFNKYLYGLVGEQWNWTDKQGWSDAQWQDYAESDNLRTWVAYFKGSIAGYFELRTDREWNVEIVYFGLAPGFIGQGFGSYLLSSAIQSAWDVCHAKRVWVHTCGLDHPNAINNYQSCGLTIYHEETSM
jgi:GNAT superfamily N-acetyltransferase